MPRGELDKRIVYHDCGTRLVVQKLLQRGGKAMHLQRGWDAIGEVADGQCHGCQRVLERADLVDMTVPPVGGRGPALKAFQRARKQARKKAAQQAVAESAVMGFGSRHEAAAPLLAVVLDGEDGVGGTHLLDPALASVERWLTRIEGWIARVLAGKVTAMPPALAGNRANLERLAATLEQITHAPVRSIVGVEELVERIAIAQDRLEDLG